MAGAIVLNIGILAVFKYLDFALENINALFHSSISLPGHRAADRHIILYISGTVLRYRCLPRQVDGVAQLYEAAALYIVLPAAHSGSDSQIPRRGTDDRQQADIA